MSNQGRLANPEETFMTDRRSDPRLAEAFAAAADTQEELPAPAPDASYADCLAYCAASEARFDLLNPLAEQAMPAYAGITSATEVIQGADGNDIPLYLHLPVEGTPPGPCVVHTHGGGMVVMTAADPGLSPLALRSGQCGPARSGRRIPQWRRQARQPSIPCRPQ